MNTEYEAALRRELEGLEKSPDRPARDRRIAEVKAQLEVADPDDTPAAPRRGRPPKTED